MVRAVIAYCNAWVLQALDSLSILILMLPLLQAAASITTTVLLLLQLRLQVAVMSHYCLHVPRAAHVLRVRIVVVPSPQQLFRLRRVSACAYVCVVCVYVLACVRARACVRVCVC